MFTGQIYIQEASNSDIVLSKSYLKVVLGVPKVYIYIPLIGDSASDYKLLEKLFYLGQIPKSVYDQALINMPLATSGEFEATETISLPSAYEVYLAIIEIPQIASLVTASDTLAQLVTAIDASGYLVSFNNTEILNYVGMTTESSTTITNDYTANDSYQIIIVDSSSNDVTVTLPNDAQTGYKWTVKVDDKTENTISVVGESPALIDGYSDPLEIAKTGENDLNNSITFYFDGTDYKAL